MLRKEEKLRWYRGLYFGGVILLTFILIWSIGV